MLALDRRPYILGGEGESFQPFGVNPKAHGPGLKAGELNAANSIKRTEFGFQNAIRQITEFMGGKWAG